MSFKFKLEQLRIKKKLLDLERVKAGIGKPRSKKDSHPGWGKSKAPWKPPVSSAPASMIKRLKKLFAELKVKKTKFRINFIFPSADAPSAPAWSGGEQQPEPTIPWKQMTLQTEPLAPWNRYVINNYVIPQLRKMGFPQQANILGKKMQDGKIMGRNYPHGDYLFSLGQSRDGNIYLNQETYNNYGTKRMENLNPKDISDTEAKLIPLLTHEADHALEQDNGRSDRDLEISGYTSEILAIAKYLKEHPEDIELWKEGSGRINVINGILNDQYDYQLPFGPKIFEDWRQRQ